MKRELSVTERLLLAQAVHEHGAEVWPDIAKVLATHPMISRPKSFFTAQSCNSMYTTLMDEAGLDSTAEQNMKPKAPLNLQLAQIHYQARVLELRELILAEELAFKTVLQEIDEIKGGLWDDKIKADLGILSDMAVEAPNNEVPDVAMSDEEARPPSPSEPSQLTTLETSSQVDQGVETAKNQDPEEDEVSMQLAPALSSPPSSEISPLTGPSLVPTYPDRDSSPPQESPVPDSPPEDIAPETHAEEDAEGEQESASRAVSEEPLLTFTKRQAKGKRRQKSTSAASEPSHQEDSPFSEIVPETAPSENADSPKPPSEVGSGIQTRRGKRKADTEAEYRRDKKKPRSDSEQGDDSEPAPTARKQRNNPKADQIAARRFQNLIGLVHAQISQHRNGNIFHNPIKPSEAPDYADIVKRPMDLKTIKTRIKDGVITNSLEYQRDVYLMFVNSMMYNRPNSDIYNMAEDMMLESEKQINTFRQTEGWNNR